LEQKNLKLQAVLRIITGVAAFGCSSGIEERADNGFLGISEAVFER